MRSFRYKTHGAIGTDVKQYGCLTQLLFDIPDLFFPLRILKIVPPRHILNEILLSGVSEAGMSGGCEWKPFEISENEYTELLEDLLTLPDVNLSCDDELKDARNFKDWNFKLTRKQNRNKKV